MAGIDELIATFMGQTDTAMNAPPAPWQQELLETVNPEKVKRQNIARALAKASTAMATTPGNFLSGVSAAAATGADSYLTGRDEAEDQRMKVQQLLGMQAQKDQDRRLSLLLDAVGVQRNQISDKEGAEDRRFTRKRYEDQDAFNREKFEYEKEQDRLGLTKENKSLMAAAERKRANAGRDYTNWKKEFRKENMREPTEEEKDTEWSDIVDKYDIEMQPAEVPGRTDLPRNGGTTPQVPSAEAAQGSIVQQPGGAPEATKTVNGKTYVKINGKWFEQQ
jgi:hypothetical protein